LQVALSLRNTNTYVTWIALQAPASLLQGWPDYPQKWCVPPCHAIPQHADCKREMGEYEARPAKRHCMPRGQYDAMYQSEVPQYMSM
jgi:hypothetical protein